MATLGQLLAQFGGHYPTATIGRISGNSDFHAKVPALRYCWHSMAGIRGGCRFYTSSSVRRRWFGPQRDARVELVQMSLESFLVVVRQAGELDAHTDAGIARAHDSGGRKPLLAHPQVHAQRGTDS